MLVLSAHPLDWERKRWRRSVGSWGCISRLIVDCHGALNGLYTNNFVQPRNVPAFPAVHVEPAHVGLRSRKANGFGLRSDSLPGATRA